MKKLLLPILILGMSLTSSAEAPSLMWHQMIDSDGTADITRSMAVTADGGVVVLGEFGSRTAADNISFNGTVIATGAATDSSSDNANLLVTKHSSKDGSLQWVISTKNGDVGSMGCNAVSATADGGVVMLVDMRSSNVTPYQSPVLVDASGAEIDFADWNTSCWIRNQVVIKANRDGHVQWVRRILADQLPVPNASSGAAVERTTTAAFPYCVAEDKEGNIIVAGNTRAPLVFSGAENSIFVIQPRNIETYSGDTQSTAGGLYLVKLDSEGNYLTHLQGSTTDGVTADYISAMTLDGDNIYFTGNFQGAKDCSLTLGKGTSALTVTKSVAENGMLAGCVESQVKDGIHSFIPRFLTCYNQQLHPTTKKSTVQIKGLDKIGESLYLYGLFQGCVAENGNDEALITSTNQMLEGYVLKMSATDGRHEAAMANHMSIGGYFGIYPYDGALYATGYQMSTGSFIHRLDATTLEVKESTDVAKGASVICASAFDPRSSLLFATSRANNKAFTLTDGTETSRPVSWGVVLTAHAIDPSLSGANAIDSDADALEIRGLEGAVKITASSDTVITVTDLKGVTLHSVTLRAGTHSIPLQAGVYIINDTKVAVR